MAHTRRGRGRRAAAEAIRPGPPERVRRPAMVQRWSAVTFVHWRVDPAAIRSLVPADLELDTFDGSAWVGLVPFRMQMWFPPRVPVPFLTRYPETNVRTYVVDRTGRRGLWFLTLDVPRSAAVVAARFGFGLPYAWSSMSLQQDGRRVRYRARRRVPASGAQSDVEVVAGAAKRGADDLTRFLTARFRLFGTARFGAYTVPVDHRPWPIADARLERLDDDLVAGCGVPVEGPPEHVQFSPGVDVRVGLPHR